MQMQEHPKGFSGETKVSGAGNSNRQEFLSLHKMIGRFNPIQALSCPHHFKVDRQKQPARTVHLGDQIRICGLPRDYVSPVKLEV